MIRTENLCACYNRESKLQIFNLDAGIDIEITLEKNIVEIL